MEALRVSNVQFIPVAHRRVTFAEQVRRAALEWKPEVIAVELPPTLQLRIEEGVERLPEISAVSYEEKDLPGMLQYVPIDPCDALIEAVRLGMEYQLPVAYIDLDLPGFQEPHRYVPDDLIIDKAGIERFVEALEPYLITQPDDERSNAREAHMARQLHSLARGGRRILCVLGIAHYPRVRKWLEGAEADIPAFPDIEVVRARPSAQLAYVDPASITEVLGEIPQLTWLYEQSREKLDTLGEATFDKLAAVQDILHQAGRVYEKSYKERITMTQWRGMLQFVRNMAIVSGRLRPDLYELVCGARGMVDGDYGWEVFELARLYPPQKEKDDELPLLKIKGVRGALEGREERFRMQSRWEPAPTESLRLGFRRRPPKRMKELWKSLWEQEFSGRRICSWPPEDEVQEKFMDYVRKRALQIVTDDRRQVQEFTTSLLDGLDVRETMRNWHTGKIYAHTTPQPLGKVGGVVVIFQDEPLDIDTSWRATLYAEHRNESDISFFATPLGEEVVGPRICRTEFGGILSVYPAWGIPDIWSFELSGEARYASDALLAAAILFSFDRYVAYIAAKPPRAHLKELAAANRKHIIYLPLTTFSRAHLKKIRKFHILDGHDARAWARDYIFDE